MVAKAVLYDIRRCGWIY